MNKIIILILCLCCAFTIARAEEGPALNPSDANIVGHVVDRKTGEHLSFITIFLKGTTIGTSTDGTGHYYLKNLPEGEFTVVMKTITRQTVSGSNPLVRILGTRHGRPVQCGSGFPRTESWTGIRSRHPDRDHSSRIIQRVQT